MLSYMGLVYLFLHIVKCTVRGLYTDLLLHTIFAVVPHILLLRSKALGVETREAYVSAYVRCVCALLGLSVQLRVCFCNRTCFHNGCVLTATSLKEYR